MPHGPRTARSTGAALFLALAAVALAGACGGRRAAPKPVATLASSPAAAAAFEGIREAWEESDRSNDLVLRVGLRARLERFLTEFPKDGLVPMAEIALAIEAMRDGAMATADAQLDRVKDVPPGTARDLFTVARARRIRLAGDPEAALALLRPLVGKSVDPLVRTIFEEELTASALATHRAYEAISYMDAWLRTSTEDEKPATVARVSAVVQELPRPVLVGALLAMSKQRATLGYGSEIQRILATRLVQIATSSGDAELARALLEADPQAFAEAGDAGAALGELAASRRGLNVVEGRTLGLLLPTASAALQDESADVLRGVLWALGLPRGARSAALPGATSAADAGAGAAACAPLEPAPVQTEPSEEDAIRLVTRDDAGNEDRTEASLDELAGEGAAVILAGLDSGTAERALRWGEQHGVPVVALVPPSTPSGLAGRAGAVTSVGSLGFVLGEPRSAVVDALARVAPSLTTDVAAPVADASELASLPPNGGRVDGMTLGPPVSCDVPAARAGEARFPIESWKSDKTRAWLASGSPDCTADLVTELAEARARGVVALTLEAAARLPSPSGIRVVSARAGVVPDCDPRDPRADEVRRFSSTVGRAGWWSALGRDAATLARAALVALPVDLVSESHAVAERRTTARDRLASAHARLWTTESSGFAADRTMKRVVCTVEAQAR
jgi:hypothetical protein